MKYLKTYENNNDNITFIEGDDWVGVYLNGKLITQGHSINERELLESLGYKNIDAKYIEEEEIWEEMGYSCPENLSDVEAAIISKKYNL